ncbi:PfkB family carbohydrate kinase [Kitasatospora azatica]|uniref:PfkB family carbohydrate kinase n=1 Tax=Kitasatospora azatica TaxID=58347 RepID=UPI000560242F|nr:PfkB family carbohydrate kinase [Kitasatospora azatica]
MVFAPAPVLAVTVEQRGEDPDVHLHADGQGVRQARMLTALGHRVVLCGGFGGESGLVLRRLLRAEGIALRPVRGTFRNGVRIEDRRPAEQLTVAEAPTAAPSGHDLDELHNLALVTGLGAELALLSEPEPGRPEPAPSDFYYRLTADLTANGRRVLADLAGPRLAAAAEGGAYLVKLDEAELPDRAAGSMATAMQQLRARGARNVLVTRGAATALALIGSELLELRAEPLAPADPPIGQESMTAGVAAGLLRGADIGAALRLGAATRALNAVPHAPGGGREAVQRLRGAVERLARDIELRPYTTDQPERRVRLSREELASWCRTD